MANNDLKNSFIKELKNDVRLNSGDNLELILEAFERATNKKSKFTTKRVKKGLMQHVIKCNCVTCITKPWLQKYLMIDEFRGNEYAIEFQESHGALHRMFIGKQEIIELRNTLDEIVNIKMV